MTIAVAVVNLILGVVYTSYGIITIIEMKRGWKTMGFSHFGAAWITMAFTCGPHHFDHGLHTLIDGRPGGSLDLATVLVGFPAGITWFLLRIEAFAGGRGDRLIRGTPGWIGVSPTVSAVYMTALAAALIPIVRTSHTVPAPVYANLALVVLYFTIGYFLIRTQIQNRRGSSGWSLSGLALGAVFPTCGLMHGVHAAYAATGVYHYDRHLAVIDWLAVPAAVYFLWVVRGLYRDALQDWNRSPETAPALVG